MASSRMSLPPWLRTLIVFFVVFLLACFYASQHFLRDPGSAFFDQTRAYDRFYSNVRQQEAAAFAADMSQNLTPSPEVVNASICASSMTVFRQVEQQYVYSSVASILEGLTSQERHDLHLKIFFAEVDATRHPAYKEPWLAASSNEVYTSTDVASDELLASIRSYDEKKMFHEKATLDYSLALQRCLDTTDAPYIAVFEDDILVARGWLARTLLALRETDSVIRRSKRPDIDWLSLRIFNQERSTGWSSRHIGGNKEFFIVALIDIPLLTGLFLLHRHAGRISGSPSVAAFVRRYTDIATSLVTALVIIPAFVILFFQSGKASLLPPSPGLKIEDFGCCTQAMIWNRRQTSGLIDYLRSNVGSAPYDVLMAHYARTIPLHRLSLYPMQVQHIGLTSAIGSTKEETVQVWSTAFETLRSLWVDQSHASAVDMVYGTAG